MPSSLYDSLEHAVPIKVPLNAFTVVLVVMPAALIDAEKGLAGDATHDRIERRDDALHTEEAAFARWTRLPVPREISIPG